MAYAIGFTLKHTNEFERPLKPAGLLEYALREESAKELFGSEELALLVFGELLNSAICVYNVPSLRRSFKTSRSLLDYDKAFQKFKLKQARMQCDDGLPVYLKGGLRDKILFNITIVLLICNTIGSICVIRDLLKT